MGEPHNAPVRGALRSGTGPSPATDARVFHLNMLAGEGVFRRATRTAPFKPDGERSDFPPLSGVTQQIDAGRCARNLAPLAGHTRLAIKDNGAGHSRRDWRASRTQRARPSPLLAFGAKLAPLPLGKLPANFIGNVHMKRGHQALYPASTSRAAYGFRLVEHQLFENLTTIFASVLVDRHFNLLPARNGQRTQGLEDFYQ
jgi:hypothetical protein